MAQAKEEANEHFDDLDADKDGYLSFQELFTRYSQDYPETKKTQHKKEIIKLIAECDISKEGDISRKEWLAYVQKITLKAMQRKTKAAMEALMDQDSYD